MSKVPKLELVKKLNQIDVVASLVLNLATTHKEQFIFLTGEIGAGKTTLVKEIAKQLNEQEEVTSPSFNKMVIYKNFVHIDAYNMDNQTLESYEDFFEDKLVIIEWAEKLKIKENYGFHVKIIFVDEETRKYLISWIEK